MRRCLGVIFILVFFVSHSTSFVGGCTGPEHNAHLAGVVEVVLCNRRLNVLRYIFIHTSVTLCVPCGSSKNVGMKIENESRLDSCSIAEVQ